MTRKRKTNPILCECGCSQPTIIYRGRPRRFLYTHYSNTVRKYKTKPPQQYCKCECGAPTTYRKGKYSTWLVGHFTRKKREIISCACGCRTKMLSVSSYGRSKRYLNGHHRRGKPSANRGRKLSKEWRHNMSLSLLRVWRRKKKL